MKLLTFYIIMIIIIFYTIIDKNQYAYIIAILLYHAH